MNSFFEKSILLAFLLLIFSSCQNKEGINPNSPLTHKDFEVKIIEVGRSQVWLEDEGLHVIFQVINKAKSSYYATNTRGRFQLIINLTFTDGSQYESPVFEMPTVLAGGSSSYIDLGVGNAGKTYQSYSYKILE
jgi:hypothetical protein